MDRTKAWMHDVMHDCEAFIAELTVLLRAVHRGDWTVAWYAGTYLDDHFDPEWDGKTTSSRREHETPTC